MERGENVRKIKVILADDHPFVLVGVCEYIERDDRYEIVAQVRSSTELIERIKSLQPDIVVTDYNMPGDNNYGDGVKLIKYLIQNFPHVKILVLTMLTNHLMLSRLYDMGVSGVILKSGDLNEILLALNVLSKGQVWHSRSVQGANSVVERSDGVQDRIASLSPKEFEVLRRFASGMSVSDIALSLNRSVKTISSQKSTAMRKLNVENDHALLTFCISMNLI